MSTGDVIVTPHQPHGAARPTWIVYARDLPALTPRSGEWEQIAMCIDEKAARVIATGLAQMSPEYLASLIPGGEELF